MHLLDLLRRVVEHVGGRHVCGFSCPLDMDQVGKLQLNDDVVQNRTWESHLALQVSSSRKRVGRQRRDAST